MSQQQTQDDRLYAGMLQPLAQGVQPNDGTRQQQRPSCEGMIVRTHHDAAVLVEAAHQNQVTLATRRLSNGPRADVVKSGDVFIYKEAAGLQRWSDGRNWSGTRSAGNFFAYRELAAPVSREERAEKKARRGGLRRNPPRRPVHMLAPEEKVMRELVGSMTPRGLLDGGLVKRTMKLICGEVNYRIVNYFTLGEAVLDLLRRPSADPVFVWIVPRQQLYLPAMQSHLKQAIDMAGVAPGQLVNVAQASHQKPPPPFPPSPPAPSPLTPPPSPLTSPSSPSPWRRRFATEVTLAPAAPLPRSWAPRLSASATSSEPRPPRPWVSPLPTFASPLTYPPQASTLHPSFAGPTLSNPATMQPLSWVDF